MNLRLRVSAPGERGEDFLGEGETIDVSHDGASILLDRISVGGRLAWVAVTALAAAARQMLDEGSFSLLDVSPPVGEWLRG